MPRLNQRGPNGEGPMTGRMMGKCTQYGKKLFSKKPDNSIEAERFTTDEGTKENLPRHNYLHYRRGRKFRNI